MFRAIYKSDDTRVEAVAKIEGLDIAADPCVRKVLASFAASENGYQGRALEAFRNDKGICPAR
jgi:hypothetical protein